MSGGRGFLAAGLAFAAAALAAASARGEATGRPVAFAKNEIETGHTMLGKVITVDPRWVLDVGATWRTERFGYFLVGVWNATELTDRYDATRRRAFNEIDPRVGYGYAWTFADGWSLDTRLEFQHSQMHYADTSDVFRQWIGTETLSTPWVDVYGFAWVITYPYQAPAYRVGALKDIPVWGPVSIEPHVYLDLGPERWNRRRFGEWTDDPARYSSGANAINAHLLAHWRVNGNVRLYAGVRHISAVQGEVRRQLRAWDSPNGKPDFTYFVVGAYVTF